MNISLDLDRRDFEKLNVSWIILINARLDTSPASPTIASSIATNGADQLFFRCLSLKKRSLGHRISGRCVYNPQAGLGYGCEIRVME